jgi:hypothetical protein
MVMGLVGMVVAVVVTSLVLTTRARRERSRVRPPEQHGAARAPAHPRMDAVRLAALREVLSQGCSNCRASTGVTTATSLADVEVALSKRCFYCGFDFAGLSAESGREGKQQSSYRG